MPERNTIVILLTAALLLSGCATAPTPQTDRVRADALPEAWSYAQESGLTAPGLLELAEAEELEALIEEALRANPNLQQTALRLREAGAFSRLQGADRLPQLSAAANVQRQDQSGPTGAAMNTLSLSLSWEADVWGRLADRHASARLDERALAGDFEAARNSLAGRIVQQVVSIHTAQRLLDVEQQRLQVLTLNETFIRDRYLAGIGELTDLETARSAKAAAEATLYRRREILAGQKRALGLLRGDTALETGVLPPQGFAVHTPLAPIPGAVVAQRPDLRAALLRVQSADRNASANLKALLPSVQLTASISQTGATAGNALKADPVWSLLGGMTAPIFQGGRLRARADMAEYAAERAYHAYQERLLAALKEVEDALGQEAALALREQALATALVRAQNSKRIFEERYRDGLADIFDLLNAQQQAFDREVQYLEVRQSRKTNRITLGLSLGLGIHG